MRRILLLFTVAVVMAAMVVGTAATAFADKGGGGHVSCDPNQTFCGRAGGGNGDAAGDQGTPGGGADFIITNPNSGDQTQVLALGSGGSGIGLEDSGGMVCGAGSNTFCRGTLGGVPGNP